MNTYVLLLTFGLLFETTIVLTSKGNQRKCSVTRASHYKKLQQILLPKKEECSCKDWRRGVEQLQEGCAKVFKKYPGLTNAIGESVMKSFKIYTDKLTGWTMCNSTILSTRSVSILQAMTLLTATGKSASSLVNENKKATPSLVSAYTKIVSELSDNIGALTTPINSAIENLGSLFDEISKQFQNRFVEEHKGDANGRINFVAMMKCFQLLANIIGLIAETALDDCGCVTIPNETYDAIAILISILNDCGLSVQGVFVSMAAVLHSESSGISEFLHNCLLSLDIFLRGVADAITSMTEDVNQSVRVLMSRVVSLLHAFNEANDNLIGPSDGANITVGQIKKNLFRP